MLRWTGFVAGLLSVAACAGTANAPPEAAELAPLKLAEVQRDVRAGSRECKAVGDEEWRCSASTGYVTTAVAVPFEAAPFQAQIYLHPEFTTEEYLIKMGAADRPMWNVRHICGGALIAPNWIATAAHCFTDPELDTKYGVRLGLNDIETESGFLYHVKEVVRRDPDGRTRDNDIALVRFDPGEQSARAVSQAGLAALSRSAPPITQVSDRLAGGLRFVLDGFSRIHLFQQANWQPVADVPYSSGFKFLDNDTRLLSWSTEAVLLTDLVTGATVQEWPLANVAEARMIAGDTRVLAWSDRPGEVRVWDVASGAAVESYSVPHAIEAVSVVGDGRGLYVDGKGGDFSLIKREDGAVKTFPFVERRYRLGLIAGERALLLHDEAARQFELVDVLTGEKSGSGVALGGSRPDLVADGRFIVSEGLNGIWVQNAATFEGMGDLLYPVANAELVKTMLADDQHLMARYYDLEAAQIWDVETGRQVLNLAARYGERLEQVVTDIGEGLVIAIFVTGIDDQITSRAEVWSLVSGRKIAELADAGTAGHMGNWRAFAGGEKLLKQDQSARTLVWDLVACSAAAEACQPVTRMDHNLEVLGTELTADETRLLARTANGTVQVWDIRDGEELFRVFHGGMVMGARLDDTAGTLITYGGNGFVRFWNQTTGREVRRLDFAEINRRDDGVVDIIDDRAEGDNATLTYLAIDETGEGLVSGADVRVFGWGRYGATPDAARSLALREAGLKVLSPEECARPDRWDNHPDLHERNFCASDSERKTCAGDSGGPVVQGSVLAEMKLVGIASWGSAQCLADGRPGVYTRIASHAEWIKRVIGADAEAE